MNLILRAALLTLQAVHALVIRDFDTARVSSYVALGDSYAAGDGAGSSRFLPRLDATCARFSDAYPVQVANESGLGLECWRFRSLACGGASTSTVIKTQLFHARNADLVTVTVGGNQVDFFVLLNACVYQWWPIGSCQDAMAEGRRLVESTKFLDDFSGMISIMKRTLKPEALLLITGYARFFNDRTDQCDHATFSRRDPTNFLTKDIRKQFNQMVTLLNDVIQAACEAHGAIYVDIDSLFEGHRFCENDISEPSDHEQTWFFNLKYKHSEVLYSEEDHQKSFPNPFRGFLDITKVFHPTSLGHKAIAEGIVTTVKDQ